MIAKKTQTFHICKAVHACRSQTSDREILGQTLIETPGDPQQRTLPNMKLNGNNSALKSKQEQKPGRVPTQGIISDSQITKPPSWKSQDPLQTDKGGHTVSLAAGPGEPGNRRHGTCWIQSLVNSSNRRIYFRTPRFKSSSNTKYSHLTNKTWASMV